MNAVNRSNSPDPDPGVGSGNFAKATASFAKGICTGGAVVAVDVAAPVADPPFAPLSLDPELVEPPEALTEAGTVTGVAAAVVGIVVGVGTGVGMQCNMGPIACNAFSAGASVPGSELVTTVAPAPVQFEITN
jgi:hypothetical protein